MLEWNSKKFANGSIQKDDTYMPHQWRKGFMDDMIANGHTREEIQNFYYDSFIKGLAEDSHMHKALKDGTKELSARQVEKKLRLSINNFLSKQNKVQIASKDIANMRISLSNELTENFDEYETLFGKELKREAGANTRSRMHFDRSHTTKTKNGGDLTFADGLVHNVEALYTNYAMKNGGRTALQDILVADVIPSIAKKNRILAKEDNGVKPEYDGITLDTDEGLDILYKHIQDELNANPKLTENQVKKELARAKQVIKKFAGEPTVANPTSKAHQVVNIVNNLTHFLYLGMAGAATGTEFAAMSAKFGTEEMISNMKYHGKNIDQYIREGKVDDELAKELYQFNNTLEELAEGFNSVRNDMDFNSLTTGMTSRRNYKKTWADRLNQAENFSMKLSAATMMASGMKPISAALRASMGSMVFNQLIEHSLNPTAKTIRTLQKEMNLSDEQIEAIVDQIKLHSTTVDGLDRVTKTFDLEDSKFYTAVHKPNKKKIDLEQKLKDHYKGKKGAKNKRELISRLLSDKPITDKDYFELVGIGDKGIDPSVLKAEVDALNNAKNTFRLAEELINKFDVHDIQSTKNMQDRYYGTIHIYNR